MMKKIYNYLLKKTYYYINKLYQRRWENSPLTSKPLGTRSIYNNLYLRQIKKNYPNIDHYEKKTGFQINKNWLNELAKKTQIVIKNSELNYSHGRILYSSVCEYIKKHKSKDNSKINILETGTALGFSSLCMAKALSDSSVSGSIITIDPLPNEKKIYWNIADDHYQKNTRLELLKNWKELIQDHIIFIQGESNILLPKISVFRINIAFLDAAHTYKDVIFEYNYLKHKQLKGDMIIFDDYNSIKFPGLVKAVKEIKKMGEYNLEIIKGDNNRDYVLAKKTRKSQRNKK